MEARVAEEGRLRLREQSNPGVRVEQPELAGKGASLKAGSAGAAPRAEQLLFPGLGQ